MDQTPRIRVVVRKRPLTTKEQKRNETEIVHVRSEQRLTVEELK